MEITFTRPEFLWFLLAIPFLVIGHFIALKYTRKKAFKFANFEAIARVTNGIVLSKNYGLLFLRTLVLVSVIFSASGTIIWYMGNSSNFDFVLAIDASSSMLADDLSPTRLDAAKESALEFIKLVQSKASIALVTFAGTPVIEERMTDDIDKIKTSVSNIKINKVGGTNIGDTLITSAGLFNNGLKSRTAILLTDGQNNVGSNIDEALSYVNEQNIIVHTIGVGTEEGGLFANLNLSSKLDEAALQKIANSTSGRYYRAKERSSLVKAYEEIASLDIRKISFNLSLPLMLFALVLLLLEWLLLNTRYTTIP